ncbi:MAG TPA: mersacidin/lichenicidin family type 2 lantibiotic [Thermoanaerobaculia bacterium]|nr:mersacidin/lichenicidin family type 2 lantibiotic [Thermoanaerobaculia bacterium]
MKKIDVVRAWRDEEYRNSLTEQERASLPQNPAGLARVEDSVLASITGGCGTPTTFVSSCVKPPVACP